MYPSWQPPPMVDNIAVSTFPSQGSLRKTTKHVTFWDPLVHTSQPHCSAPTPTSQGGKRKTTSPKVSFTTSTQIKSSKWKSPPHQPSHAPLSPSLYIAFAPPPRCSCPRQLPLVPSPSPGHYGIEECTPTPLTP